jgi:DnaJ-domain-containing protein 1
MWVLVLLVLVGIVGSWWILPLCFLVYGSLRAYLEKHQKVIWHHPLDAFDRQQSALFVSLCWLAGYCSRKFNYSTDREQLFLQHFGLQLKLNQRQKSAANRLFVEGKSHCNNVPLLKKVCAYCEADNQRLFVLLTLLDYANFGEELLRSEYVFLEYLATDMGVLRRDFLQLYEDSCQGRNSQKKSSGYRHHQSQSEHSQAGGSKSTSSQSRDSQSRQESGGTTSQRAKSSSYRSYQSGNNGEKSRSTYSGRSRSERSNSCRTESSAYAILSVDMKATDDEVRRAYRRLMAKYHPDKLSGQGASQEQIRAGTERVAEARKAYENIKKLREKRGR